MNDMKKRCDLNVLHLNMTEEILAWLPVETVCRFRSVSKEWNALLSSREFITNKWVKKPPNRNPWLVAVQVRESSFQWLENGGVPVQAPAFCFFNQTWQETSSVSLSFLHQHPEDSISCFGSAAGLFLLQRLRATDLQPKFVVCNPLTRRSLELPVLSLNTIAAAGIMSHSGDAYKVVVVGTGKRKGPLRVEIYDSIDKYWRVPGRLPKDVNYVGTQLVFCDGYFYCWAFISERLTLLVYNIAERTSMFRPLPGIDDGQGMVFHLLACGSRVLLAAHILRNREQHIPIRNDQILEVIIWELEKVNLNSSSSSSWWKEIVRMPPSHLERFRISGNSCVVGCINCCVGVGNSICFMVIEERKVKDIIAYSVTENTWSWLPNRIWVCSENPMAFEPRPDMKVD